MEILSIVGRVNSFPAVVLRNGFCMLLLLSECHLCAQLCALPCLIKTTRLFIDHRIMRQLKFWLREYFLRADHNCILPSNVSLSKRRFAELTISVPIFCAVPSSRHFKSEKTMTPNPECLLERTDL